MRYLHIVLYMLQMKFNYHGLLIISSSNMSLVKVYSAAIYIHKRSNMKGMNIFTMPNTSSRPSTK